MEISILLPTARKGCRSSPGWLIYSKKDYADFEIEFEYRLPKGGRGGVLLRAGSDPGSEAFTNALRINLSERSPEALTLSRQGPSFLSKPHIGLKRRRFQCLPGLLLSKLLGRKTTQLIVDQRQEFVRSLSVTATGGVQKLCHFIHDNAI